MRKRMTIKNIRGREEKKEKKYLTNAERKIIKRKGRFKVFRHLSQLAAKSFIYSAWVGLVEDIWIVFVFFFFFFFFFFFSSVSWGFLSNSQTYANRYDQLLLLVPIKIKRKTERDKYREGE